MSAPHTRPSSAPFRPRFTLSLFYLAFFFLAYSLLLVSPELSRFEPPADPADDEAALAEFSDTIRQAAAPRLPYAVLLSLATLALGIRQGWLPGLRPPELYRRA